MMCKFNYVLILIIILAIKCTANDSESDKDTVIKKKSGDELSSSSSATRIPALTTTSSDLPPVNSSETEHNNSWTLCFILSILAFSILLIHVLITTNFHFVPESLAVIFFGALVGLTLKLLSQWHFSNDWSKEESFPPTIFFLVLLPPIIFESGYNLHKGNFFQNIGSILVFAIIGTAISAFAMGAGVYLLGKINFMHSLSAKESFAFGSLISAVDPVATLAIFNALDIDPVLYMLVFGESILNDAVAIVLTNTIMTLSDTDNGIGYVIFYFLGKFMHMFFTSALIGCVFGILSALLFKHVEVRKTPSLEMAFMFIFMYSPYAFAEAVKLSGIMAILFAGIVMSHYTHNNLSSITRITIQQTFRTLSFISETCVYAYLGLAIFSFRHVFKPSFVIFSILMCLLGRALNIFPLSFLLNYFREHKITKKMQFIMWFSGLRGAIAFALSLNLQVSGDVRHIIVTSTLILVLFTTLILGGSTLPLMRILNADKNRRHNVKKEVFLSKTKEMGDALDDQLTTGENVAQFDDENGNSMDIHIIQGGQSLRGFARFDEKFLKPLLIRKFTAQELKDGKLQMNRLTKQWCDEVRGSKDEESLHKYSLSSDREELKNEDKKKKKKSSKSSF